MSRNTIIPEELKGLKPDYIPFPAALRTVDVVPFYYKQEGKYPTSSEDFYFLLGRKLGLTQWQTIGGFVEPTDISSEEAAVRELDEEANIKIPATLLLGVAARDIFEAIDFDTYGLFYIGSHLIDDERYQDSEHKLTTSLYLVPLLHVSQEVKNAKAGDDIEEIKWFSRKELMAKKEELIVKKHLILIENVLQNA